jgi:hypothetical protein
VFAREVKKIRCQADPAQLAQLDKLFAQLDPFVLKETIEAKLRPVLRFQVRRFAAKRRSRLRSRAGTHLNKRRLRRPAVGLICSAAPQHDKPVILLLENYFPLGVFSD